MFCVFVKIIPEKKIILQGKTISSKQSVTNVKSDVKCKSSVASIYYLNTNLRQLTARSSEKVHRMRKIKTKNNRKEIIINFCNPIRSNNNP